MIENKKFNIIAVISMCFAVVFTLLTVGYGNRENAKTARQMKYVTELFGDDIISINIIADETDWNNMISNATAKEYIMADVIVNGIKYQSVGVRTKGNASLSQVSQSKSPERYSLHITFNEYIKKQTCCGLDTLILNNMISDSTYMKEYMSQDIMRYIGVDAPLTNYADISVNGEVFGFYVALEYYGESYIERIYEDTTGNLYNVKSMQMGGGNMQDFGGRQNIQINPENIPAADDWNDRENFIGMGGGNTGGTLQYTDDEISSYSAIFNNAHGTVSETDQKKVIEALKNLSDKTELEKYFNIDEILRYFAAHTVVVNLDSYNSSMAQNYFIYERDGQISILPWDYHLSYGAFQSGSASDIVNFPIDTPVSGVTMESRPLLNVLLSNNEYRAKYHDYLQDITDNYFNSGLFENTVRNLQSKISEYVKNDSSAFYTYDEFNTGVDTLIQLNMLRAESIEGQLNGSIQSTADGQKNDSSVLVDASAINMSDLGSNGMGGMGNFMADMGGMENGNPPDGNFPNNGNFPNENGDQNRPDRGGNPFGGDMPDMEIMQQAMQIIQEAGGEITDDVKLQLLELGLTEEQINMLSGMQGNRNGMQGGFNPPDGNNNLPGQNNNPSDLNNQTSSKFQNIMIIGILLTVLAGGTIFVCKFKRKY